MRSSKLILFSLILTTYLLTACAQQAKHLHDQSSIDPGKRQSPINIITHNARKELSHRHFIIHFQNEVSTVENLGHTVQLDFAQGSSIYSNGINYSLEQMHFHTPSEHLIDGMTFPMELHIVSKDNSQKDPRYLVIGILFKMGQRSSFIDKFLTSIPKHEQDKLNIERRNITLADLLPLSAQGDLGHHFHYKGSLTTPPFSENVQWYVLKTIHEATPEQIESINQIEGNNARAVESTYGRQIDDD